MNAIGHIVNACYYMQESFDNKTHEKDDKRIINTVGHTGYYACWLRQENSICQDKSKLKKIISTAGGVGIMLANLNARIFENSKYNTGNLEASKKFRTQI